MSSLPTILGFMKLKGLQIDGNPLKLIKRTIIEKGKYSFIIIIVYMFIINFIQVLFIFWNI